METKIKILLVDDDKEIRKLFKTVLEKEGYTVFVSGNAKNGMEIIATENISLVVSDLRMPEMSGIEFLQRVKLYKPDISFIMLTGSRGIEHAIEAMKRDAFDYLLKPVTIAKLTEVIKNALEKIELNSSHKRDKYLKKFAGQSLDSIILYNDIIDSSRIIQNLPTLEDSAKIYDKFLTGMTKIVEQANGYILKYVGDMIIAFFPYSEDLCRYDMPVNCAKEMVNVLKEEINPFFKLNGLPKLKCKISLDIGKVNVLKIGTPESGFTVDLFGDVMNTAAKICSLAGSDEILITEKLYERLPTETKSQFIDTTRTYLSYRIYKHLK